MAPVESTSGAPAAVAAADELRGKARKLGLLLAAAAFRIGVTQQMLQQIALGGAMIALPIYLQMVLEYNAPQAGLSLAPLSLSMFGVALLVGKKAGDRRPASIVRVGFLLVSFGFALLIPFVPGSTAAGTW